MLQSFSTPVTSTISELPTVCRASSQKNMVQRLPLHDVATMFWHVVFIYPISWCFLTRSSKDIRKKQLLGCIWSHESWGCTMALMVAIFPRLSFRGCACECRVMNLIHEHFPNPEWVSKGQQQGEGGNSHQPVVFIVSFLGRIHVKLEVISRNDRSEKYGRKRTTWVTSRRVS